jgi:pimeloyl-ACP methyl ester carboxylesterase
MKVSQVLLDASLNAPLEALQMVNVFSRSTLAPPPSALGPGTWVFGSSFALGKRIIASNPKVNLYHRGFKACDSYAHGEQAMAQITCPVLFVLGAQDQMTQPKAANSLIEAARSSGKSFRVTTVPVGHHQMTEAPEETLAALREFLQ